MATRGRSSCRLQRFTPETERHDTQAGARPSSAAASRPARRTSAAGHGSALVRATVFVRIRPLASEGGHCPGSKLGHRLESWTQDKIVMSAGTFNFPTKVIFPEATQHEAYETMLPSSLDAWMHKRNNLMVLAYGQTGTGKTHTMFGPQDSLQHNTPHPDWGVLPRVVHAAFLLAQQNQGLVSYVVTASAIEFYMGMCFDLLNDHMLLEVDAAGTCLGHEMRVIEDMNGFYRFLADVRTNRTTAATRMNTESSRSHCAILITLFQLDHESGMYTATKFNLFDLAGSERVDKTGEPRYSAMEVGTHLWGVMEKGKDITQIPVGMQGAVVNMELSALAFEITKATDAYSRGRSYNPPRQLSTAFQRYTGEIMTGRTLLNTVICISPAPQHGSENLFSLKWGEDMAKLKAPNIHEKPMKVEAALEAACALEEEAAQQLRGRNPTSKYWNYFKSRSDAATQRREILEHLISSAS